MDDRDRYHQYPSRRTRQAASAQPARRVRQAGYHQNRPSADGDSGNSEQHASRHRPYQQSDHTRFRQTRQASGASPRRNASRASAPSSTRSATPNKHRSSAQRSSSAQRRSSAQRSPSAQRRSTGRQPGRTKSALQPTGMRDFQMPAPKLIALAVAAIALVVFAGFAISRCAGSETGHSQQPPSATMSTASQNASSAHESTTVADSSASAASPSDASASSEAAHSQATSSAVNTASRHVVNAQQGSAIYPVAQAAKLKHRDADFAVNPSRTTWNRDRTNGRKTIYLTFDDGPSANTERVLDVLDAYGCKATFFVTGQNPEYFPWIKEAYSRGHTIGLHSMTHDYESCYSSPESFWAEFDAIGQAVKDQIGYVPCFIRFPGGASNTISADYSEGIMTHLVQDVQQRGYQYYDWETSCGDGAVHTAEELIEAGCQPLESDNVIYLAHDGAAKESTAEALPSIIEYYQTQGYTFEAIDRSTLLYQHGVSN